MPRVVIDARLCKGCRLCVAVCAKKSLRMSPGINARGMNTAEVADETKCSGCLNCAVVCPDAAIEITGGDGAADRED